VTARSYLYVPGDAQDRLVRSTSRGADAVIADLEDSIAPAQRRAAVEAVAAWLATGAPDTERWVRITSVADAAHQLARLTSGRLDGIVIPKVAAVADVARVVEVLDEAADRAELPVRVMPLIETAKALQTIDEIAAHPRVAALQLGELDLAADLGVMVGPDEHELLYARSRIVAASAASRLEPPIGGVSPDFVDLDLLRATTQRLQRLGFVGRAVIHPRQVPVVHEVFTPTPSDVEEASRMIAAYEATIANGRGVLVGSDGRMVDEAVVRMSRRTVALARGRNARRTEQP
jgi:citrate lyase subunit beta/citryl-CoA lyase